MNSHAPLSGDAVWSTIVAEAEDIAAADAITGNSLSEAIFAQTGLGSALAFQIGRKLGDGYNRETFRSAASEAFEASPALVHAAAADLQGIHDRDPASGGFLPIFLNFKGYAALQAWRVANWLWLTDHRDLALLLQNASSVALQVSIHPAATVGRSVFLDHGTGIVVGAFVTIGDDVTILQNVTLGRSGAGSDSPTIGRGVYLSAGATILGKVTVGDFAKIGAGAMVLNDVPPGCTAVGTPARLVNCPEPTILPQL
jgi:serine O-acetyltransferase